MRLWRDAMWGIIRRDAILFVSYRTQLLAQFLGPLFSITLFYYISHLLTAKTIHSPGGYFGFVIVGLVIVQILTVSLGVMPVTVRQELVSGTIERFLVSAHGPVNGILGTMLFPLINAILSGVLMLTLAAVIFGLPLAATAFLAIPVALLGVIAFMPFAFFLVSLVMAFKQVSSATQFIVAGIAIVGGLYFPDRGAAGMDPLGVRSAAVHPGRRSAASSAREHPPGAPRSGRAAQARGLHCRPAPRRLHAPARVDSLRSAHRNSCRVLI